LETDLWGNSGQQSITNFVQKSSKPPPIPPVTKAGIKEHLLALVATCDLVSFYLTFNPRAYYVVWPFRFVERPVICGFITYLNHKVRDEDIPHKTCIADAVNEKVLMLEEITLGIVDVRYPLLPLSALLTE
jgi:hypothetical protein